MRRCDHCGPDGRGETLLYRPSLACRHLGAVALLSFLPLAAQNAREHGASPLADELEALRQNISQAQARIEEEAERQAIQDESALSPSAQADPSPPEKAANAERQTESEKKTGSTAEKEQPTSSGSSNGTPHTTLKRSSSPDGRIDSLSIEIDVPITKSSMAELQEQALRLIALQDGIWQTYRRQLQEKEKQNHEPKAPSAQGAHSSARTDDGNQDAGPDH